MFCCMGLYGEAEMRSQSPHLQEFLTLLQYGQRVNLTLIRNMWMNFNVENADLVMLESV